MTGALPLRPRALAFCSGLMLLVVLAYAGALTNPFVYDDARTVVYNPSLRDLSNLLFVFAFERFRPLVNLSYAVDFQLWGLWPPGFRITNIACHLTGVLAFFFLARALLRDALRATGLATGPEPLMLAGALAAALFAVHPLMTQAVGYVSGRSAPLSGCLFLLSLLAWRRHLIAGGWWWSLAGWLSWILALASKEIAAILPLILLLYDRLLLVRAGPIPRGRRLAVFVPLLGVMLAGGMARVLAFLAQEQESGAPVLLQHGLTQAWVAWRYVQLLAVPVGQSVIHAVREAQSLTSPLHLAAAAGWAAVVVLAWRLRRSRPVATFGIAWFLLTLLPASALPLAEPMAEQRAYLASCGLFLLAAGLLAGLSRVTPEPGTRVLPHHESAGDSGPGLRIGRRWAVPTLLALALVALTAATVARNRVWSDPIALWRNAVHRAPRVYVPLAALAQALQARGDCEEATSYYRRALELVPTELIGRTNLGVCLAKLGRHAEAEAVFESILAIDGQHMQAHNNLATLALIEKRWETAAHHCEIVLRQDPHNRVALRNLTVAARHVQRR